MPLVKYGRRTKKTKRKKKKASRPKRIRNAQERIAHRILKGVKHMTDLELSEFLLRNVAKVALEVSDHVEFVITKDGLVIRTRK